MVLFKHYELHTCEFLAGEKKMYRRYGVSVCAVSDGLRSSDSLQNTKVGEVEEDAKKT